jgi:hypothetical protein
MTRIAWIAVATAGAVALLTLATSAALWVVHQRHRAEVDARGAETAREINAGTAAQNHSDREPM